MSSTRRSGIGPLVRARIHAEILWTWAVARRHQRNDDIRAAIEALRRPRIARAPSVVSPQHGWFLAQMVDRTLTALPLDSRCLMQSLVLTALIARRGGKSTLVIGVRGGEEFGAHAWVEIDGRPVMAGAGDFPRLTEL